MASLSRAFAFATVERYASVLVNLGSTVVISRLLTPAEFGIVVIAFSAATLATAIAELGASSYIVQSETVDKEGLRSVFTVNALLTLGLALILLVSAEALAAFYRLPQLKEFLQVFALGFAAGPLWTPVAALMARNLAFGRKSAASVAVALVNSAAAILLAMQGFSHMSFAWAYVISNSTAAVLYPVLLRDKAMFGFSLRDWRAVLSFGAFGGVARLLSVVGENVAYLIMGRFLSPGGIGLLFRAGMLLTFPDRVLLGAASAVALPAFSEAARADRSQVGAVYVRAVELLSAVHWPVVILIGLLAHPLTLLFLGPQWVEAVTYVQIMACAALFNAPMSLNQSAQIAAGAIRATPLLALFQVAVTLLCVLVAAPHGPKAIAWSVWVSTPINVIASIWLVRRAAPFSLAALCQGLARSGVVTLATAAGPLVVVLAKRSFDLGIVGGALALVLAMAGWTAGLALTRHPLLDQAMTVVGRLNRPRAA